MRAKPQTPRWHNLSLPAGVLALGLAGWMALGARGSASAAPPAIRNLTVSQVTAFSAVIAWETDVPSSSIVEFGAGGTLDRAQSEPALLTEHRVTLTSLPGGSLVRFRVRSVDSSGGGSASPESSFTTLSGRVMLRADGAFLLDGRPFIPILQWLQAAYRISYQKTIGINTFMGQGNGESPAAYLAECARQGVQCIVDYDAAVQTHASLLGWYWVDEPEMPRSGTAPEKYPADVRAQYELLKAADPYHPFFMTFTARFASRFSPYAWMEPGKEEYTAYANAVDVPGFDEYPVYGWCQPSWIGEVGTFQQELIDLHAPGKPTFQWIEAVRTSSQWCELAGRGEDDGPTAAEIRNEVWQAIARGARAIGYFTHSWECPGYTQFCLNAAQIAELTRTNRQILDLTPAILGEPYGGAVSATASTGARVDVLARVWEGNLYLFAAMPGAASARVTFTIGGWTAAEAVVFEEGRTLALSGGAFSDDFPALGVHIYRIGLPPAVSLAITPRPGALLLNWSVSAALPEGCVWTITVTPRSGGAPTGVENLPCGTRMAAVSDLANYQIHDVSLEAFAGGTPVAAATGWGMPSDRLLMLPLIANNR